MNDGQLLMGGLVAGLALGTVVAVGTYVVAPPITLPAGWGWLAVYGRIGVAAGAGWFAFVFTAVLTVFAMVARGFAEMGAP